MAEGGRQWTLCVLLTLDIWNERNAGTFENVRTMPTLIFDRIKSEARTRVIVSAKYLDLLIAAE
jgi:hypothetical protein